MLGYAEPGEQRRGEQMSDEAEDIPATRQARLKAQRRARRTDPRRMRVTGKGVFLIRRLVQERAERARRRLERREGDKP